MKGSTDSPTIFTSQDKNATGTIQGKSKPFISVNSYVPLLVYNDNQAWTIQDLVFDNVNIDVNENENEDETSINGNLFFNGGRGSIMAKYGEKLYISRIYNHYVTS